LLADAHGLAAVVVRGGRVDAANAAARRLFGDAIAGAAFEPLFDPGSRAKLRAALRSPEAGTWELQVATGGAAPTATRFIVLPLAAEEHLLLASSVGSSYSEQGGDSLLRLNDQLTNLMRELSKRIRELETTRAALERIGALHRQFVATLAHDLRSPLGVIRMAAGLIRRKAGSAYGDELRRHAETVDRNVERMLHLVEETLLSARLELGGVALRLSPTSLNALATEAAAAFAPLAEQAQVRLSVEGSAAGGVARVDRTWIYEILSNLVANALRHAPPGSVVRIRVSEDERLVRCAVIDQGPGVPPSMLEEIFQPLRRYGKTPGSSGLGLFLSGQLVALHGGRIWAEHGEGKGASFVFELPKEPPGPG
jgi:signal transduction histidine kinase